MQTRPPDEVLVVHRRDDGETIITFNGLRNLPNGNFHHFIAVDEVFSANLAISKIAFLDADAEAHRDWLERLSAFYVDPSIGGGGRYLN
jgi:hypothetical protein